MPINLLFGLKSILIWDDTTEIIFAIIIFYVASMWRLWHPNVISFKFMSRPALDSTGVPQKLVTELRMLRFISHLISFLIASYFFILFKRNYHEKNAFYAILLGLDLCFLQHEPASLGLEFHIHKLYFIFFVFLGTFNFNLLWLQIIIEIGWIQNASSFICMFTLAMLLCSRQVRNLFIHDLLSLSVHYQHLKMKEISSFDMNGPHSFSRLPSTNISMTSGYLVNAGPVCSKQNNASLSCHFPVTGVRGAIVPAFDERAEIGFVYRRGKKLGRAILKGRRFMLLNMDTPGYLVGTVTSAHHADLFISPEETKPILRIAGDHDFPCNEDIRRWVLEMVTIFKHDEQWFWTKLRDLPIIFPTAYSNPSIGFPNVHDALHEKISLLNIPLTEKMVVESLGQFLYEINMVHKLKCYQGGISSMQFLKEYHAEGGELRLVGERRFNFFSELGFAPLRLFGGAELKDLFRNLFTRSPGLPKHNLGLIPGGEAGEAGEAGCPDVVAEAYAFCLHNGIGAYSRYNKACLVTMTVGDGKVYLGESGCKMRDMIQYGVFLYEGAILCGMNQWFLKLIGSCFCVADSEVAAALRHISMIRENDDIVVMNAAGR